MWGESAEPPQFPALRRSIHDDTPHHQNYQIATANQYYVTQILVLVSLVPPQQYCYHWPGTIYKMGENFRKPAFTHHFSSCFLILMVMTKMMMYHDGVRDANDALTHFIRGQSILVQCHCQTTPLCPSTISPCTSRHDATRSSSLCNSSSQP